MKKVLFFVLVCVAALGMAWGCTRPPQSHRAIRVDVTNYNQAVDVAADVLRTYFEVDAIERGVPVSTIHTKPLERREMERPERRTAVAKITKLEERVAEIEVKVYFQKDLSDTGYSAGSAANPAWGEKTPDSTMERKILLELQDIFNRMQ